MIIKAYHWFLWAAGAAITDEELEELKGGGDMITFWFRRSKKRLGIWWWVSAFFVLLLANFKLYHFIRDKRWGWAAAVILFDIFSIWFLPHVVWGLW